MADDAMTNFNAARWAPTDEQRAAYFPDIDPGMVPLGSRVLVQLKRPGKLLGRGFLIKTDDRIEADQANTQVALIRAMGPLAFHNRTTLAPWPEGQWCHPGDFVLVPRFGQCERWQVPFTDEKGVTEKVEFRLYDDVAMLGHLMRNPEEIWG